MAAVLSMVTSSMRSPRRRSLSLPNVVLGWSIVYKEGSRPWVNGLSLSRSDSGALSNVRVRVSWPDVVHRRSNGYSYYTLQTGGVSIDCSTGFGHELIADLILRWQ